MATGVTAVGQASANLQQAAQSAYASNKGVYDLVRAHTATSEGYYGGGALVFGGYFGGDGDEDPAKALKEYQRSLAAATKDRIVRGLARALSRAGIDVREDASAEEIARTLKEKLPDPKKGKTFVADAEALKKVCHTVADVLNDEFTPGAREQDRLIDTSLGAVSVCRQVAELVHSLSTGLHTEFLEVHASLTRVLRNLEVLDEVLRELHLRILSQVEGADLQTGADKKIADFEEVYVRAQRERERQMAMLRNFLSVTLAPAQEELAIAMRDEGEAHDVIARLQLAPGAGEFADSLAMAVSGLGTVAAVSSRVDRALKAVGMNVQDYVASGDMDALEQALDSKLMSGDVDANAVGQFLKAVQTLKENFYRRSELAFGDAGAAKAGGYARRQGGRGYQGGDQGGDDELALDRRVEKRKTERKLIVKEFIDKSSRQYDALLKAVQELGPHLGKQVVLSDKLEALRNALARLGQSRLGALNLELSLIGYYGDAAGREKKETFLAGLRVLQGVLDEVMGMELYRGSSQYFAAMRAAIDGLVRTIDFYSDVIMKKYGSGDDGGGVTGGQPEELSGLPEIARSSYDLERAVNAFLYFYYVAKIRSNLRQTHTELEYYGEKYHNILGDAVASRLRQLTAERDAKLARDVYNGNAPTMAAGLAEKAKKFIKDEYECKANFYRALQALDLYMKAFTDGVVAHPDEVTDVKRMLDGVTIIGRWFVEDTGDDLAAAFDMMPGFDGNSRQQTNATTRVGAHYYEKVAASEEFNNVFVPGIPQLSITADKADNVRRQVAKVFDNFQALKNLTNAFARIGDKFGGRELRREVFMSPFQIYKALLDYLKCSALSIDTSAAQAAGTKVFECPAAQSAATAPFEVFFGSVLPTLQGNFAVEDQYFSFCVKAMAAKILTVIGVYDLFERPSPVYELTPTRMIIGGADFDAIPEVIPEAAELYFRLPRLVEFYKNLFAFDEAGQDVQISMLPEIEGVFSGIIRLVFQRVEGGAAFSGDYSDLEVRALVREINAIYENFRGSAKGSAISEALSAFVMEINRRYGLVKKSDWLKLRDLLRESRRAGEFGALNQTNYAILPGEEEYQPERRAPSDRYLGPSAADETKLPGGKSAIDDSSWTQWAMLKLFREKLDSLFATVSPDEFTTFSFSTVIRQGELEMRRAEGVGEKIGVAARLIQGSGSLAGIDVGKAFMFHETVVVGLNLLNAVYSLLARVRQRVVDTDVVRLRTVVKDWFRTQYGAGIGNVNADRVRRAIAEAGGFSGDDHPDSPQNAVFFPNALLASRAGSGNTAADTYALLYAAVNFGAQATNANDGDPPGLLETFATYVFDSSALMGNLLEVVVGLTSTFQGLVQARFPGTAQGQLHLDFSGLRGLIHGLMDDVRFYMDVFRPHMAKSVIQKFEDRINPGSFYWLEENLLDNLVRGLPDDTARDPGDQAKTLEWMARTVNSSYAALVGYNEWDLTNMNVVNVGNIANNGWVAGQAGGVSVTLHRAPRPGTAYNYEQFGRLFASLVYYDAVADNSGLTGLGSVDLTNAGGIDGLVATQRPGVAQNGIARRAFPLAGRNNLFANFRVNLWSGNLDGLTENRSLLVVFNQLLAQYLGVFYDNASGKLYRNLVDSFANGSFSRSVMTQGNSLPDLLAPAGGLPEFGRRGDPLGGGVLCQSLALALQRLVTDLSPSTQTSEHLVATLSEIPLYIRESFRANLPAFIKLFELVQKKGEFYKQLMSQTGVQVGRPYGPQSLRPITNDTKILFANGQSVTDTAPGPIAAGATAYSVSTLASSPAESDPMKLVLARVIDGVAAGCYSISNAAAEVLREIADEALYLQTQESSIQEYKARYGKTPLMPLSSSLTYLRDLNPEPRGDTRLMPVHSAGDETFKLMYGTRKLLGRPTSKFSLADAPGIRANIDSYNGAASGREKVDIARFETFLANAVSALRFVVDTRSYCGILASAGARGAPLRAPVAQAAAGNSATIGNITSGPNANTVYALRQNTTPQMALAVTESSYQDQELRKIGDTVGSAGPVSLGQDRKKEWIYNVIDMNIIPINVHALMRGVPLAPLYNYVYTFEQMVALLFGQTAETINALDLAQKGEKNAHSTRQAFLKLLQDPYAPVSVETYGNSTAIHPRWDVQGFVTRIFRGDDSLMMGRPKFLSDQLFNKVLFGTLVDRPDDFDETGPPGSGRMAAGVGSRPVSRRTFDEVALPTWTAPSGQPAVWGYRNKRYVGIYPPPAVPPTLNARNSAVFPETVYGALTFIGQPDENGEPYTALKQVQLGEDSPLKMAYLEMVGRARFDARIVRNLFFITNVQRVVRLQLNQELTQYRNVLVSNHSVTNPGVTEYGMIPPSNLDNPRLAAFGPGNETLADRRYDNETRLVH